MVMADGMSWPTMRDRYVYIECPRSRSIGEQSGLPDELLMTCICRATPADSEELRRRFQIRALSLASDVARFEAVYIDVLEATVGLICRGRMPMVMAIFNSAITDHVPKIAWRLQKAARKLGGAHEFLIFDDGSSVPWEHAPPHLVELDLEKAARVLCEAAGDNAEISQALIAALKQVTLGAADRVPHPYGIADTGDLQRSLNNHLAKVVPPFQCVELLLSSVRALNGSAVLSRVCKKALH